MLYEYRTVYRHENGEVEGFVGQGSTKEAAKLDSVSQIGRKLAILADEARGIPKPPMFYPNRVIKIIMSLTKAEHETVQADWRSGVRYI